MKKQFKSSKSDLYKTDKKIESLNFGQFLFLYFLGRNVEYNTYEEILKALPKVEETTKYDQKKPIEVLHPGYPGYPDLASAPQPETLHLSEMKARKKTKAEEAMYNAEGGQATNFLTPN